MKLTPAQSSAVDAISDWLASDSDDPFVLAGYAGTGKTTLLQEFINAQDEPVTCCCYTGKAASVLARRLTNSRVTTIHKALYKPSPPSMRELEHLEDALAKDPNNEDLREAVAAEKRELMGKDVKFSVKQDHQISPGDLIVVDEASMVTRRIFEDLGRTGAKILYVGDPGQLPPVKDAGFFCTHPPDVMLEEVLRQALDSPIIRMSMKVRKGESISYCNEVDTGGTFIKADKSSLDGAQWLEYDQVITGTNLARRRINRYFRRMKYGTILGNVYYPISGDKLICLKNETLAEAVYVNGVLASATEDATYDEDFKQVSGTILWEGNIIENVPMYRYPFWANYDDAAVEDLPVDRQGLREFDYGYAITVHKSQGSEWDRVILADDGMQAGNADFRKLWLYTAITRAKKELLWLV